MDRTEDGLTPNPRAFSIAVVGADYPNKDGGNRRSEIAFCNPGDPIELRPEPRNPHDEHAIAVFTSRGFQIGYLPSERAVFVGGILRDGHTVTAIFQDVATYGAVIRAAVDAEPTLPEPRSSDSSGAPAYDWDTGSDEVWPDEVPDYD